LANHLLSRTVETTNLNWQLLIIKNLVLLTQIFGLLDVNRLLTSISRA